MRELSSCLARPRGPTGTATAHRSSVGDVAALLVAAARAAQRVTPQGPASPARILPVLLCTSACACPRSVQAARAMSTMSAPLESAPVVYVAHRWLGLRAKPVPRGAGCAFLVRAGNTSMASAHASRWSWTGTFAYCRVIAQAVIAASATAAGRELAQTVACVERAVAALGVPLRLQISLTATHAWRRLQMAACVAWMGRVFTAAA